MLVSRAARVARTEPTTSGSTPTMPTHSTSAATRYSDQGEPSRARARHPRGHRAASHEPFSPEGTPAGITHLVTIRMSSSAKTATLSRTRCGNKQIVACRLSVVGCRLSVVGCRLSVVGCRLSVVGCRFSVVCVGELNCRSEFKYRALKPRTENPSKTEASLVCVGGARPDSGNIMDRRAAERRTPGRHAAVVVHHDLLHDGQPQAGAARTRGEERLEHPRARGSGMPGPLSSTDDAARPFVRRSASRAPSAPPARVGARFGRVANQVAEHLAQQHLVALDVRERASRTRTSVCAAARAPGRRRRAGPRARSTAANTTCSGRANFRKFVTTWPSASVSCRMPSTYGR